MSTSNYIAVIADDLTGANDTALQFFLRGAQTQVAFGEDISIDENLQTEVFAMSTESRNTDAKSASEKVLYAAEHILKKYNFEHIYKKIDSVIRGNIAAEITTLLNSLNFDAAVIFPAFPSEGRTTIGGFQLLKGIPLQRTEVSRDPAFPIMESNILNILRSSMEEEQIKSVDLIPLDIIMKGAGPILLTLNDLISKGKKLIVADAVSTTDLEQIALAISKSNYKVLPAGSAGAAQALSNIWHPSSNTIDNELILPKLPKLVISGSATDLTASQIKRLQETDSIENTYFIPIKPENIFSNDIEEISQRALHNMGKANTVVIHSSELIENNEKLSALLLEKELSKEMFISSICNYLAALTGKILSQTQAILITIGGETSYKCLKTIGTKNIQIKDTVAPAIPLGIDHNGRYIVTKSGNLGTQNTLIEIIKYFEQDK